MRQLPGAGTYAARSAMALGRIDIKDWVHKPADPEGERMWPFGEFGSLDEDEFEPGDLTIEPRAWLAPAFYNPGVGMWQIDDAGLYPYLNHGERASTVIGGRKVADQFRDAACGEADATQRLIAVKKELNHWHACTSGTRNMTTMLHPSYPCLEADDNRASYSRLYVEPAVEVGIDGLHVTTGENPGDYQIAGGGSQVELPLGQCRQRVRVLVL